MKKKLLIAAGALLVLLLVGLVVVGMSLGKIIKTGVETVGPKITQTDMKLDSASLSLLSGSGTLKGFLLGNPEGFKTPSAMKAGAVSVGVQPKSLFSDKVHVTHVRVEGAEVTFEGTLGKANNLSKILENVKAATAGDKSSDKSKSEGPSKKLQVDEFTVTGTKVHLSMTLFAGKAVTMTLPDIQFKNLGAGPDGITASELTERLLSSITVETLKAVEKAIEEFGKNAAGAVTKTANESLDKATKTAEGLDKAAKSVGDLFKKK